MVDRIFSRYEAYREPLMQNRRFKQEDIRDLVQNLQGAPGFEVEELGKSLEGREIYLVKIGRGDIPVMMWSQMHGDEATATQALFDLFNFLKAKDEFQGLRDSLLERITLWCIPMLNPDGAARFERRNALGIDINRDAIRRQSPEAQILKALLDRSQARFGFNLHDQSRSYRAGFSGKPATLSFLAPAYDMQKSLNPVRADAMRIIGLLSKELHRYIPDQVARYNDDFEPRAFGDNFQKWGTSTVLVESGGYAGDREKQFVRKLNFLVLLRGIEAIAEGSYVNEGVLEYEKLPYNQARMFDLLVRNATYLREGKSYVLDLGIDLSEVAKEGEKGFWLRGSVTDLGDLSTYSGYKEIPARNLELAPGKVYPKVLKDERALLKLDLQKLLNQGYLYVRLRKLPEAQAFTHFPINLIGKKTEIAPGLQPGARPDFVLKQNGQIRYVVVNGQLFEPSEPGGGITNGVVE